MDNVKNKFIKSREEKIVKKSQLKESIEYLRSDIEKSRQKIVENQQRREGLLKDRDIILGETKELINRINLKNEESLRDNKDALQREKGSIEQRFDKDREIRERNRGRVAEIEKEKEKLHNLNTLLQLLGGTADSFNIYVQRLTLIELIKLANIHLQKFAPRYRLKMYEYKNEREALKFGLIDFYQIGVLREIDTSSGGEKFIISLALALGLSELASKNIKIKSLFIDEGFGTLDNRSLDIVIQTLENLKQDDKLIGIISHVESLKDRIATQISIKKMGNGVSLVKII
jgi:exonuclease SbcC